MDEYVITINGEIGSDAAVDSGDWGIVGISFLQEKLALMPKGTEDMRVKINSPGGNATEGFGMHDTLKKFAKDNDVQVTTEIAGLCASIATVIFLSGSVREISENSDFMIHNPWMLTGGDAKELRKRADELEKVEQRLAAFYSEITGRDEDDVRAEMAEETFMSSDEALEKGFATDVIETIKLKKDKKRNKNNLVFAKIDPSKMKPKVKKNKKSTSTIGAKLDSLIDLLTPKKAKKKEEEVVNLEITLEDGAMFFVEAMDEESALGEKVSMMDEEGNLGEAPEDGDYLLDDGRTLSITNGVVKSFSEVEEEETEEEDAEEMAKLGEKIDKLISAYSKNDKIQAKERKKVVKDMNLIKASIKSRGNPGNGTGNFDQRSEKAHVSAWGRARNELRDKRK